LININYVVNQIHNIFFTKGFLKKLISFNLKKIICFSVSSTFNGINHT
jgi:hypothetical protein